MNGKQAKRLRKTALDVAVQLAGEGKVVERGGYVVHEHKNHFSSSSISSVPGNEEAKPERRPSYQLLVRPHSLKAIYKTLKRGLA